MCIGGQSREVVWGPERECLFVVHCPRRMMACVPSMMLYAGLCGPQECKMVRSER